MEWKRSAIVPQIIPSEPGWYVLSPEVNDNGAVTSLYRQAVVAWCVEPYLDAADNWKTITTPVGVDAFIDSEFPIDTIYLTPSGRVVVADDVDFDTEAEAKEYVQTQLDKWRPAQEENTEPANE